LFYLELINWSVVIADADSGNSQSPAGPKPGEACGERLQPRSEAGLRENRLQEAGLCLFRRLQQGTWMATDNNGLTGC